MKRKTTIKLFGYERGNHQSLLELREVTTKVDADTAEALGKFFLKCAIEMRENPHWEHLHFDGNGDVDLVVYKEAPK